MCLAPDCRNHLQKISEPLQGHALAGLSFICMKPSQKVYFTNLITLCGCTLIETDVFFFFLCTDIKTILRGQINIKCAVNSCGFP